MPVLGYRKTYPAACRHCADDVFVHTNGYGDWVLFDDLGQPWPIHSCYSARAVLPSVTVDDYDDESVHLDLSAGAALAPAALDAEDLVPFDRHANRAQVAATSQCEAGEPKGDEEPVYGTLIAMKLMAEITRHFGPQSVVGQRATPLIGNRAGTVARVRPAGSRDHKSTSPPEEKPVNIVRCEPKYYVGKQLHVTGFITDVHVGRSVDRLAEPGTVGYAMYRRLIGADVFSQVTVIDTDAVSYTAVVPMKHLDIPLGSLVTMHIRGVDTGHDARFVCKCLDEVAIVRAL